MQFKVLGPLEVVVADRAVTPQPAKIRSLLAMLCVKSGTVVSRECLIDALWAGDTPRTARTALQVYVSKLRKYLDLHGGLAGRLMTKPHGYVFELEPEQLDLREFDILSRWDGEAGTAGSPGEALDSLQAACLLWRGPALADLRGLPAFDKLARQLDEKRINVLERRFDMQLSLGQHKRIIGELYGLVDEYPMWESIHAQLMISLYRSGRVAESLEAYRRIRNTLVLELGLEPGDGIRGLHQSILGRDPALDEERKLSLAC
ncbi:AfsR/SARP family transcriptional regulator [Streptomyces sp. RKAG337]|uniref:AfsR/SARP family transcriptional regulator n=1 Tax=Streptomyces sp. RKAG337 TaxID=2893404 RepID=UPI0020332B4E|nr:AfsR/SARP family transcriptional regulator [Streptomyces sp. RKAG337]MCM2427007.1 AfsR/SARP family transcriptional regulator [Streptomyces sp. RKAG337]